MKTHSPETRGALLIQLIWVLVVVLAVAVAWLYVRLPEGNPAPIPAGAPGITRQQPAAPAPVDIMSDQVNGAEVAEPGIPGLAVIIDDLGRDHRALAVLRDVAALLTLSILPQTPHAAAYLTLAHDKGWPAIAHVPMEPVDIDHIDHPGCLIRAMTDVELRRELSRLLAALPGVMGLSNHMGSRLTSDRRAMAVVARAARQANLLVLDSRTADHSVLYDQALAAGALAAQRDAFLDLDGSQVTAEAVEQRLRQAIALAYSEGRTVVVIGHPYDGTLAALAKLPALANGLPLVPVAAAAKRGP